MRRRGACRPVPLRGVRAELVGPNGLLTALMRTVLQTGMESNSPLRAGQGSRSDTLTHRTAPRHRFRNLTGERYRFVMFDRRGHGRTADTADTAEEFHHAFMADEAAALIETMNLAPVGAIGYSDGGAVLRHRSHPPTSHRCTRLSRTHSSPLSSIHPTPSFARSRHSSPTDRCLPRSTATCSDLHASPPPAVHKAIGAQTNTSTAWKVSLTTRRNSPVNPLRFLMMQLS